MLLMMFTRLDGRMAGWLVHTWSPSLLSLLPELMLLTGHSDLAGRKGREKKAIQLRSDGQTAGQIGRKRGLLYAF